MLPGLIDAHVHLFLAINPSGPPANPLTTSVYDTLLAATRNAEITLQAGFTTARDLGAYTPAVVALKKAVASGVIEGPRLWVSGGILGPTGGHGDQSTGFDPAFVRPDLAEGLVDSPEEAVRKVRERHRAGADVIKVAVSGGVISVGDDPNAQLMTDEEIRAVVETAHTLHMKVAAHVHGKVAIEHAAQIGVDSIEHGAFADAATYAVLKSHGTYLVPTLMAGDAVVRYAKDHPAALPAGARDKAMAVGSVMSRNAFNAYKAGVRLAFGTDAGVYPHGRNAGEFRLLVDAGIPPIDAILSATMGAADLLGASADVGSVQAGRFADIIATDGHPLIDIDTLQRIDFVMKGGDIVRRDGAAVSVGGGSEVGVGGGGKP